MSSIFLFAQDHGKVGSSYSQLQNDLHEKLKEISEQIKRDGVSIPDVLRPLTRDSIAQCVIGPSHIAFRLKDGQVCRVAYTINSDRLSQKSDKKKKQGTPYSDSSGSVREGAVSRTGNTQHAGRSYRSPLTVLGRTSRGISFLREMHRQGIYLARPVAHQIPESEIPEVLIEECQTVLQGKSRQVIVRELQNTNLDVNMAVNNLLSRDDEAEQGNGGNSSDGNAQGGGSGNPDDYYWDDEAVELLSFFEYPDSHGIFENDGSNADETAGPPTSPRFRSDLTSDYDYSFITDRRKRRRIDPHLYSRSGELYTGRNASVISDSTYNRSATDPSRNSNTSDSVSDNAKQSAGSIRYYVQLCDTLEFWPDPDNSDLNLHFVHIVALHSELVALNAWGELHQWRWADATPFVMQNTSHMNSKDINDKKSTHISNISEGEPTGLGEQTISRVYHPRVLDLGLAEEKVIKLSGCATRATVLTDTGKFATWMDESLIQSLPASSYSVGSSSGSLGIEHRGIWFPELRDEVISEIYTAPLVTVVHCLSGSVYWWGVYPSYMRQRAIEKLRQNRAPTTPKKGSAPSKNLMKNRYFSSLQSNNNTSFAETTGSVTGEINAQNVNDMFNSNAGIVLGSFVCIRSAPIFHAGAIGFTVMDGVPKVGTLLEDAWKITDVCRFRVNTVNSSSFISGINDGPLHPPVLSSDSSQHLLTCPYALGASISSQSSSGQCLGSLAYNSSSTQSSNDQVPASSSGNNSTLTFQEMPPPPSPASSTCSDQSGPVRVSPGTFKRKKVSSVSGDRSDRVIGDWDIGNQNNGRNVRGRSADRDSSFIVSTGATTKRGSTDLNNDTTDMNTKSDGGYNRASGNSISEEDWCLSDVVFVEDGRTQPVGIVLKVDGNIAAVKFLKEQERLCVAANCPYSPVCTLINSILGTGSSSASMTPMSTDPMSWLNDCRLLRKEDLTIVRNAGLVRVPDVIQRTPRRVFTFPSGGCCQRNSCDSKNSKTLSSDPPKILAIAAENSRIHVIVGQKESGSHQPTFYQVYNLSGKLIINQKMPYGASAFKSVSESKEESATIVCPAEHPLLLRDPGGLVLPFIPPSRICSHETWISPFPVDLPPVQCASFSWIRNNLPSSGALGNTNGRQSTKSQSEQQPRCLFGLVVIQDQTLMQHILRANDVQIERLLATDLSSGESLKLACELADGRRNLLHMAVSMCAPQSNRETTPEWLSKLEPVLASPRLRPPPVEDKDKSDKGSESKDTPVIKVTASNNSSHQPSFWSSLARRSSSMTGSLSMHELFIRSSIEAATVAAAAALSNSSSRSDSEVRTSTATNTTLSSANGVNFWHFPPVRKDEITRRVASYRIVHLLIESRHLLPSLIPLLTARNTDDLTPLMLAVKLRAYSVARYLYEIVLRIVGVCDDAGFACIPKPPVVEVPDYSVLDFFCPSSHKPDDSPLFQLCYNDTCSFTWTGPDHIRQDIFECRTCGLMDSLCCCTECARVCHKGHDCRLKRTSPTAYCDCWEKCCCQSLISGFQASRHELFYRLLFETKLVYQRNGRGEHLLLYLAKCVDRQAREQRQHRPSRRRLTSTTSRTNSTGNPPVTSASNTTSNWESNNAVQNGGTEEPDHDLEPPRFCRDALELALDCPTAVYSMLMSDNNPDILSNTSAERKPGFINEDQVFLSSQGGTNQLDDFVFTLICKCPTDKTDIILATLNKGMREFPSSLEEISNDASVFPTSTKLCKSGFIHGEYLTSVDMKKAAARFVRSVARVYASLCLELAPDQKKKSRLGWAQTTILDNCRRIFTVLPSIALNELPMLAASLLVPIRMGTVRPCASFSHTSQSSEITSGLESLINAERNYLTRQQLLSSSESTKSDDLPSRGIQSIDDGYRHHHSNFTEQTAYHNATTERGTVSSRRHHNVVSTLHVQLSSPPHVTISDTSDSDTVKYTQAESNIEAVSPNTATSSIHDPSLLTLQMQSTITDIETSAPEHVETVMNPTADNFDSVVRSEETNTSFHPTASTGSVTASSSYLNIVGTSTLRNDGCSGTHQIQASETSEESHSSPAYEPSNVQIINSETTSNRPEVTNVSHTGDAELEAWSYSRRQESPYHSDIFPLLSERDIVNDVSDSDANFPSCSNRRLSESSDCHIAKRRRTMEPGVVSPESKDDNIELGPQTAYSLSPSAQDELPLSILETDGGVSQTSSTAVTLGSTTDLDIGSELSTSLNVEMNSATNFTNNMMSSQLPHRDNEVSDQQHEEIGFSQLLNSEMDLYESSLTIQEGSLTGEPGCIINEQQNDDYSVAEQSNAFHAEDASDGQASDYDEYDEQDDGDDGDDHEDDDDENETEDEDADQDVYGDGDQLIEGEDEEEDEEEEDDSSHHSDASSADAGSRSTSPTWVSWPRTSFFSRLGSRAVSQTSDTAVTSANSTDTLSSIRELNPVTTSQSSANITSVSTHGLNASSLISGRRAVQSVINLNPSTSTTTPTLVITSTGNTTVSTETAVTNSTTSVATPAVSSAAGCIMTTQVYLCRACACLLRVTADLVTEVKGDPEQFSTVLRRTSAIYPISLSLTIYEQQRRMPVYRAANLVSITSTSYNQPQSNITSSVSHYNPTSRYYHTYPIKNCTTRSNSVPIESDSHCAQLVASVGVALIPIWQWASSALDNLEAQLRFSTSWNACLPNKTNTKGVSKNNENQDGVNPVSDIPTSGTNSDINSRRNNTPGLNTRRPVAYPNTTSSSSLSLSTTNIRSTSTDISTASNSTDGVAVVLGEKQDVLAYLFSIMRASGGDHGDSVPIVDPQVNKHLAYILDALLYFFRAFKSSWPSGITRHMKALLSELNAIQKLRETQQKFIDEIGQPSTSPVLRRLQMSFGKCLDSEDYLVPEHITQRSDSFFRRSESVLSLSGVGPDLLDIPLSESLPLALQPQLLQPTSERAELFGCHRLLPIKSTVNLSNTHKNDEIPIHMNAMSSTWGERMCRDYYTSVLNNSENRSCEVSSSDVQQLMVGANFLDSVGQSATLLSRWCSTLEFFGNHFASDVGTEQGSYYFELGGFPAKEVRFRKQMERLRNLARRDLVLEVEREHDSLILNTIKSLNVEYSKRQSLTSSNSFTNTTTSSSLANMNDSPLYHPTSNNQERDPSLPRLSANASHVAVALLLGTNPDSPLLGSLFNTSPVTPPSLVTGNSIASAPQPVLTCRRIKVTFKDEPGEGTGVARSFFTAFTEAVLSQESLPNLSSLLQQNSSSNLSLSLRRPYLYSPVNRSQPNTPTSRQTSVLVQSTASSLFQPSTQSVTSSIQSHSVTSGQQITPSSQASVSIYPYHVQPRAHTYTVGSRPRLSAWRRTGALSANASPFYPVSTQAVSSSVDCSPQTSSSNASAVQAPEISHANPITTEHLASSRCPDISASTQPIRSSVDASPVSSPDQVQDLSDTAAIAQNDATSVNYVANRLFAHIEPLLRNEQLTARVTGMLLELPASEHAVLLTNEEALCNRVDEARALITMSDTNEQNQSDHPRVPVTVSQPVLEGLVNWRDVTVPSVVAPTTQSNLSSSSSFAEDLERVPLFWQPGLQGYYFPRAVPGCNVTSSHSYDSTKLAARYSIYRGIGRVIGLCLLTNETCPLHFSRPVLKCILGRVLHWHDFAFYDPATFEGLRQLLLHTSEDPLKPPGSIEDYNLTFSLIPALEEGGSTSSGTVNQTTTGTSSYALVPGGDEIEVNESNVFDFVKKYTEFKMLTAVQEPLQQLRQGVFDVLPRNAFDGLTPEDLRLLLNGTGDIDVDVLSGYTTFLDETGTGSNIDLTKSCDNVNRLKKWFWSTVRGMDTKQRQDLLYFWTSSPTLPASALGFQPAPSVTVKPPDDHHLPSANTCISRLYIPLYSSRHILRNKLLQAIETKSFGFV
uniref:UBR-type domain-containing protein n=1 Tax=Trichobilharzia regenti TaxID=157069 RepID=A0AA85JYG3_TRIRE|nr:unnamed protein product [Trichobilharzia regenti]